MTICVELMLILILRRRVFRLRATTPLAGN